MFLKLKFEKKDTIMHRLDPRAKLLLAIAMTSYVFTSQIYIQLSLFAAVFLISAIGKVSREFVKIVLSSTTVLIFIFVLNYFYSGLAYAIEISMRFLNLISIFSTVFLTTMPDDLGLALDACRFPSSLTFILVSAAKATHTISREAEEISQAYTARGGAPGKGVIDRLRALRAIFIPLISISIRRSLTMAEALEMRAFGSGKRTSYREMRMGYKDVLLILISLSLLAIRMLVGEI